jgi:hypothetical protein
MMSLEEFLFLLSLIWLAIVASWLLMIVTGCVCRKT